MSNTYILAQYTPESALDAEAVTLLEMLSQDSLDATSAAGKLATGARTHALCLVSEETAQTVANILASVSTGETLAIALTNALESLTQS